MTAFFTRCYKKNDVRTASHPVTFIFCCILLLFAASAWAVNNGIHVKSAELVPVEDAYVLNADFDINLGKEVEEALNKGVALTFLVEFQLVTPRKYWFDDEVITTSTHITLSYHALSRQFLLNRDNHQQSFASLQEAKESLAELREWQVLEKSLLKKGESYQAALRIRLDQSRLPKPLQVEAIGSEDWNIVSQRYHWTPVFAL